MSAPAPLNDSARDAPARLRIRTAFDACTLLIFAALAGCATTSDHAVAGHTLTTEERRQLALHSQDRPGVRVNVMKPSAQPMPLATPRTALPLTWNLQGKSLSIDDYFQRHPVMALLIAKDGEIVFERYQFGLTAEHRFLSNSMAKSITGLGMGLARADGFIPSFDALAQTYLPQLTGTAYGETTLQNLMNMASGVKYEETYKPGDDHGKFRMAANRVGVVLGAKAFNVREAPQGTRFHYASIETSLIGAVLQTATRESLARYLEPRLWQAIGAEGTATWFLDGAGLENAAGGVRALPRDYLRLGIILANDGQRPDTGKQVIPREFLLDSTDWHRVAAAFRPRNPSSYYGYSNYFWLENSRARRFMLLGIHGQAIFVDPAHRLVMVHLAASEHAKVGEGTMGNERAALWRAVVQHYGKW